MRTAALALGILLAACVSPTAGGNGGGSRAVNVTGSWKLDSIGGTAIAAGTNPRLTLSADGHANGNGGCNGFGGEFTREGDTLTFSRMISTMMACVSRGGADGNQTMSQEHRFLSALNGAVQASAPETNTLVLTTPSGEALRFERAP